MKHAACLIAAFALAGCSSDGAYQAYFKAMRESFRGTLSSGVVTRQAAAAVPYASMGVRYDGSAEQLIVLALETNGDQIWTSKSHIVLLTRNGRIQRTVGLDHDLTQLSAEARNEIPAPAIALKGRVSSVMTADFSDLGVYSARLDCDLEARGPQTIKILGRGLQTIRVNEACRAPSLNWQFTNVYWVDPDTGFVWRSVQTIHPGDPVVQTEIFRPSG